MLGRAAAGALLVLSTSCVRVEAYACGSDDECLTRDGGVCEASGYCSYPDLDCPSGQRYGGLAGSYADRCTEPPSGTTEVDPTLASSTSTLDPDASTTSGVDDVPERVTATGSMEMPGEIVWSFTRVGAPGLGAVFSAVEAIDDAHFIVAGYETPEGQPRDVLLARYAGPDDEVWNVLRDNDGGSDRAYGMARGGDGLLYLAGEHAVADGYEAWLASFDTDGEERWYESLRCCAGMDVAYGDTNMVLAVGRVNPTSGFALMHRSWNAPAWEHPITGTEVTISAAGSRGGELFVGGALDGRPFLARVDDLGVHELLMVDAEPEQVTDIQHIVATEDAIFVAGYIGTIDLGIQAWLARFDLDGALQWERLRGEALADEWESLAIGARGELYVAGFDSAAEDFDISVAAWTQEGDEVWARTYPELDHGKGIARDLAVLPSGDLLVVGEVEGPAGDLDAFAARLSP